jgi:hypothetical protein
MHGEISVLDLVDCTITSRAVSHLIEARCRIGFLDLRGIALDCESLKLLRDVDVKKIGVSPEHVSRTCESELEVLCREKLIYDDRGHPLQPGD